MPARCRAAACPGWRKLRRDAIERFAGSGLPTTRDEDWKYTSLRAVETRRFDAAPRRRSLPLTIAALAELVLPDAHLLVFVDGRFAADALLRPASCRAGAMLTGLASLLAEPPGLAGDRCWPKTAAPASTRSTPPSWPTAPTCACRRAPR